MGKNSKIEWTDHTWNPWIGCTKVSQGCANCYAERLDKRTLWDSRTHWGPSAPRLKTSESYWRQPRRWNEEAERLGVRQRVFCASMADVFEDHPDVVEWRSQLWRLIEVTPELDWLLLTKRPENILHMIPEKWIMTRFPRNIWLGTSAEDQGTFEARWNILDGQTHYLYPSVLFLSLEPLLGPIDLELAVTEIDIGDEEHDWNTRVVDWVIAGGESGPDARPMHPDWARRLRDQCAEREVPFFFKQWGEWKEIQFDKRGNGDILVSPIRGKVDRLGDPFADNPIVGKDEFKHTVAMQRMGKHAAGRLLDGHEWNQFPEPDR